MAEHEPIDARLGDVPLPDGLRQRLSLEALFDDDAIDRLLRGVPIPDGLGDCVLAGRGLAGPGRGRRRSRSVDLGSRLLVSAPRDRMPSAGAAGRPVRDGTWTVVAGAVLLASILLLLVLTGPTSRVVPRSPIEIAETRGDAAAELGGGGGIEWHLAHVPDATPPGAGAPPRQPETIASSGDRAPPAVVVHAPEPADPEDVAGDTPAIVGFPVMAPQESRAGDPMEVVPQLAHGGRRSVPRARGYDRVFELRYGEPPFVYPAAGPAVDAPPLSSRTASFDSLRWSGGRIRRAEAMRLRVEDVLAAGPERFTPRPDGDDGPRLSMHGVRSLRPVAATLVEIEVMAPRLPRPATPVEAAIVLDLATSPMAWSAACRGLRMLAAEMRSADRLTIVVGGERSRVAGRRLDAAAVAAAAATLEREKPCREAAGIVAAVHSARQLLAADGCAGPVVLVGAAAGRDPLADAGLGDARIVRLAAHVGQTAGSDPTLTAPTGGEVGRAIVERVFGRSAVTATGCRLSVAFAPQFVHAYRLVGYRQTAVESLAGDGVDAIDMLAGQSIRVVYELVGRPVPPGSGAVATATFSCRTAAAEGKRSVTAALDRAAIETAGGDDTSPPGRQTWIPSPRGCELLLAVGLGELASESVHLGQRAGGPAVADLARAWRRRGDVTPWGDVLIESLERLGFVRPMRAGQDLER